MKKYIIIGLGLNLLWFIWVRISWYYSPMFKLDSIKTFFFGAEHINGGNVYPVLYNGLNILLVVYTMFIIIYHANIFTVYKKSIWESIAVFSVVFILTFFVIWAYLNIPLIGKEKAASIADSQIEFLDKYERIYTFSSKGNWIFIYRSLERRNYCVNVVVDRTSTTKSELRCEQLKKIYSPRLNTLQ